jgi:hypothetical protein
MRVSWGLFLLIFIGANPQVFADPLLNKEPAFERTLVMSGGALNWPIFSGIIEGMQKNEKAPDLLVGLCGASIAVSWAALGEERWIEESYDLSRYSTFAFKSVFPFLSYFAQVPFWSNENRIGDFAKHSVLGNVDELLEKSALNTDFSNLKIPTIIFGTKLLYDPYEKNKEMVERRGSRYSAQGVSRHTRSVSRGVPVARQEKMDARPRFQIVIFTDEITAAKLPKNLKSHTVLRYASDNRAFVPEVEVITTARVHEAVRASISDPVLIYPAKIGNDYYITGAVENFAVDMFHDLSGEIYEARGDLMQAAHSKIFESFVGLNANLMRSESNYLRSEKHRHINFSYFEDIGGRRVQMNPSINKRLHWVSRIPETFEEFYENYSALRNLGKKSVELSLQD